MSERTIIAPCFLGKDEEYIEPELKNTNPPFKVNKEWVCTNWFCPIRGRRGVVEDVYKPIKVFLGGENDLKWVIWCEGAGLLKR